LRPGRWSAPAEPRTSRTRYVRRAPTWRRRRAAHQRPHELPPSGSRSGSGARCRSRSSIGRGSCFQTARRKSTRRRRNSSSPRTAALHGAGADSAGVITRSAPTGRSGGRGNGMIATLGAAGGRDAVFGRPGAAGAHVPRDTPIQWCAERRSGRDRATAASARVAAGRSVTRTFEVRVGLADPPAAMRLGATVWAACGLDAGEVIDVPATALLRSERQPAVWVVDPADSTVALRQIEVLRFIPTGRRGKGARPGRHRSSRRCPGPPFRGRRSPWWIPPVMAFKPLRMGAQASLVVIYLMFAASSRAPSPSSGSAGRRTRPSPCGTIVVEGPSGRAPPST